MASSFRRLSKVLSLRVLVAITFTGQVFSNWHQGFAGMTAKNPKRSRISILAASSQPTVEVATSLDLRSAADIAARSLRWTKGWLDEPKFRDVDYNLLSSNEEAVYRKIYLSSSDLDSTMLVARAQLESSVSSAGSFPWSAAPSRRIVGCVGCSTKCFRKFTSSELPMEDYDGGKTTELRPVMADLAVDAECRGQGIARRLVSRLEDVARKWGYDELLLLVEISNFQATAVYERLGYRLSGIKPFVDTKYLDNTGGSPRLSTRRTVALVLRKSLKPFPYGAIENLNWPMLLAFAAACTWVAQQGELELPAFLQQLASQASSP